MLIKSRRRWFWIVLFLTPVMTIFVMFYIYPIVFVFVTSLLDWNGIVKPEFVGLQNYIDNFKSISVQYALRNNFIWIGSLAGVKIALAALVAMILARNPRGWKFLRTAYFIPNVISQVAIAMMWRAIYNADYGLLNRLLMALNLEHMTHNWLGEISTALPSILIQQVFYIGYFMIIILAYTMTIPRSLYEAADIDGATIFQQEIYITIPMIRPILITTVTLATAYAFRHFEATYLLTDGGPAYRTNVMGLQLYKLTNALDYGHANAIGSTLIILGFLMIVIIRSSLGRKASSDVTK